MRAWMPLWLFPMGLLGTVVLVSLGSPWSYLLALVWGFVLVPHLGKSILERSRRGTADQDRNDFPDVSTHYWRITL